MRNRRLLWIHAVALPALAACGSAPSAGPPAANVVVLPAVSSTAASPRARDGNRLERMLAAAEARTAHLDVNGELASALPPIPGKLLAFMAALGGRPGRVGIRFTQDGPRAALRFAVNVERSSPDWPALERAIIDACSSAALKPLPEHRCEAPPGAVREQLAYETRGAPDVAYFTWTIEDDSPGERLSLGEVLRALPALRMPEIDRIAYEELDGGVVEMVERDPYGPALTLALVSRDGASYLQRYQELVQGIGFRWNSTVDDEMTYVRPPGRLDVSIVASKDGRPAAIRFRLWRR